MNADRKPSIFRIGLSARQAKSESNSALDQGPQGFDAVFGDWVKLGKIILGKFLGDIDFRKDELAVSAQLQVPNAKPFGKAARVYGGRDVLDAQVETGVGVVESGKGRPSGLNGRCAVLFARHRGQSPVYQVLRSFAPGQE